MQFYLEALLHIASSKIAAFSAAAFAATLAIAGILYTWPGEQEIPADAVTVSGPIFTPVALTPPAPMPAINPNRPGDSVAARPLDDVSLIRAVQQRLNRARCYNGPVNGAWNGATRRGMAEFTSLVNARLPLERPAPELLALLEIHEDTVCLSACVGRAAEDCAPRPAPPARKDEFAAIEEKTAADNVPNPSGEPGTASAEIPDETLGAVPPPVPAVQKPSHRKYKKNSFSRAVSKGFKQLQRSFNSLF